MWWELIKVCKKIFLINTYPLAIYTRYFKIFKKSKLELCNPNLKFRKSGQDTRNMHNMKMMGLKENTLVISMYVYLKSRVPCSAFFYTAAGLTTCLPCLRNGYLRNGYSFHRCEMPITLTLHSRRMSCSHNLPCVKLHYPRISSHTYLYCGGWETEIFRGIKSSYHWSMFWWTKWHAWNVVQSAVWRK